MKFPTLTRSQMAAVTIIAGMISTAAYASWSQGHIDWDKFGYALLGAIVAYCRSLAPANNGGPLDPKSGQATTDTGSESQ